MSDKNSVIKKNNVLWVVTSNVLTLLTAVVIGLVLPKSVSFETYAGYRTYTLYIGFASLFHLGFVNGVALIYGDTDYADLPKEKFRSFTGTICLMQLMVMVVLFGVYLVSVCLTGRRQLISPILFVIVNLLFTNLRHYFSTIDKFSARFSVDGALLVAYDLLQVLGFLTLIAFGCDDWLIYLLYTTVINAVIFVSYLLGNRRVAIGTSSGRGASGKEITDIIKRGSFVMLGEMIGVGILGADSIFAQLFFDDRQFSEYTFAVYIIVAAFTLMSAADNLVFPYLKRLEGDDMPGSYILFKRFAAVLSAVMLLGILLLRPFVKMFIPAYEGSIPILMILGGTLVFRALQGLACGNFFRALDMEREYFFNNIAALFLAVIADAAAYLLFGDLRAIAFASVLVYILWFAASDRLISAKMGCKMDIKGYLITTLVLVLFYVCGTLL